MNNPPHKVLGWLELGLPTPQHSLPPRTPLDHTQAEALWLDETLPIRRSTHTETDAPNGGWWEESRLVDTPFDGGAVLVRYKGPNGPVCYGRLFGSRRSAAASFAYDKGPIGIDEAVQLGDKKALRNAEKRHRRHAADFREWAKDSLTWANRQDLHVHTGQPVIVSEEERERHRAQAADWQQKADHEEAEANRAKEALAK